MTDEAKDPREPFYLADLDHRERIRNLITGLEDEELDRLDLLFNPKSDHHKTIPYEFIFVGPRVRALIRAERKRRAASGVPA